MKFHPVFSDRMLHSHRCLLWHKKFQNCIRCSHPKVNFNTWKVLTYWKLTQRSGKPPSNRSQAICFSWQEQKSLKYRKSSLRERGDHQLYSLDSHWNLKAIHRLETRKGSWAWQVPKVKSSLCMRNINWYKSFISI